MRFVTGLNSRDRRALGIGGAVVVMVLGYRIALPALGSLERMSEANQVVSDRLAFAGQDAVMSASIRDTLAARIQRLVTADTLLLSAGSPAHVASELGAIVRASARSAGLELLGATTQSDSVAAGPFRRAQVRLDAQGDVSGLMQFLLLIELAPGLLDVRELSITPAEPAAGGDRAEVLRVSLTIEGVARAVGARTMEPAP